MSAKMSAPSTKPKVKAEKPTQKPKSPAKPPVQGLATPEKKSVKPAVKEEQKSSATKKVMSDRDFKKFLEEVQVSAVSNAHLPRMTAP